MRKFVPVLFMLIALNAYCQAPPTPMFPADQSEHQQYHKNRTIKASSQPPEVLMQKADGYFNAKKYAKAYPIYQQIVFERNSSIAADAQMKLAQSYYYLHKFSEAEVEYEQLIKLFPDYPNINLAYYQIGVCYLELSPKPQYSQEETQKAIDAFQTFIDKFPTDKLRPDAVSNLQKAQYKLIEKEYNNGYIYYMMADYSSALLYFNEIIALANKDRLERMSLYYSSKIYIAQHNSLLANQTYQALSKDFPGSKETRKIKNKLKHLKS
jgi:outer membrane protein assembly factor BamD